MDALFLPEPPTTPQEDTIDEKIFRDDVLMDLSELNFLLMLIPSIVAWKVLFTLVELMNKQNQITGLSRQEIAVEAGIVWNRGNMHKIFQLLIDGEIITVDATDRNNQIITVSSDFIIKSAKRREILL